MTKKDDARGSDQGVPPPQPPRDRHWTELPHYMAKYIIESSQRKYVPDQKISLDDRRILKEFIPEVVLTNEVIDLPNMQRLWNDIICLRLASPSLSPENPYLKPGVRPFPDDGDSGNWYTSCFQLSGLYQPNKVHHRMRGRTAHSAMSGATSTATSSTSGTAASVTGIGR